MPHSQSPSGHSTSSMVSTISAFVTEWTPLLLVVCYFAFSVAIYLVCSDRILAIFWFIYLALNFYVAATTVVEAFLSLRPIREARAAVDQVSSNDWKFPSSDDNLPILDIAIVAYLPNEQDIIINRIHYFCNEIIYPQHLIRINCLYNTPCVMEPLESEIHALCRRYDQLRVIEVPNSTSKADNLNFFFSIQTGADVIAVYDCDHYPHPYTPRWAIERFIQDSSVDIVQGRCVVFNAGFNILTSLISIEFDKIYACSHPGRAVMTGFGLFAGSNGYWRAPLLREHKMDGKMLTEDIDSALRAFSKGWKVVHDLNVVSYELAPTSLASFWKQRMRWAQGWTQASIRHLILTWNKSPSLYNRSFAQRFGIFSLLFVRETSYYLVTQYTCLMLGFLITSFPRSGKALLKLVYFQYSVSQWCFFTSVICLFATLYITNLVRNEFTTRRAMVLFAVVYPFYLVVMATMGLYAHARQITAYSHWNPTTRN